MSQFSYIEHGHGVLLDVMPSLLAILLCEEEKHRERFMSSKVRSVPSFLQLSGDLRCARHFVPYVLISMILHTTQWSFSAGCGTSAVGSLSFSIVLHCL